MIILQLVQDENEDEEEEEEEEEAWPQGQRYTEIHRDTQRYAESQLRLYRCETDRANVVGYRI